MEESLLTAVFLIIVFLIVMILTAIFMIKQGKDKKEIISVVVKLLVLSFVSVLLVLGWGYIVEATKGTWAEGIVTFIDTILEIIFTIFV